jgi:toxin CcdB
MPIILEGDSKMHLFPQQMATVMTSSLVTYIGSAAHQRDEIIRACDLLLTGY